jgi:hypothetical protein
VLPGTYTISVREYVGAPTHCTTSGCWVDPPVTVVDTDLLNAFVVMLPLPLPTAAVEPCVGDCNADGVVRIDELIRLVAAALAVPCPFEPELCPPPDPCLGADANGDGLITVNELAAAVSRIVAAVGNTLEGCP